MRLFFFSLVFVSGAANALAVGNDTFPQSVASGDPRPDSVVLWTRIEDPSATADVPVTLKFSTTGSLRLVGTSKVLPGEDLYDDNDGSNGLLAQIEHDGVVKARITGLTPDTTYYYQFSYGREVSPIGRTKTAPDSSSTRAVRFAAINCNDYVGRYYNVLKHLCEQESQALDFVVNLGDYIYETTGDPTFQGGDASRAMVFSDPASAIELTSSTGTTFFAASSISNYRDIYKTIRQDPQLQRLHELFPVISIWDDHEYSDDRWREVATFHDGKIDETNLQRLHNAEQVWYEFLPTGLALEADGNGLEIDANDLFPNTVIYDNFDFGETVRLILNDQRSFRPDHIIPENAFPATIVMDEATTEQVVDGAQGVGVFDQISGSFDPYVDIDVEELAAVKAGTLQIVATLAEADFAPFSTAELGGLSAAEAAGAYAQANVTGNLSASYLNELFAGAGLHPPFDGATISGLPRGVSYFLMGKLSLHTDSGSRYQLVNPTFQLYAGFSGLQFANSQGTLGRDQDLFGPAQTTFLQNSLSANTACWPVFTTSAPFTPILLDLSDLPPGVSLPTNATLNDSIPITAADLGLTDLIPNELKVEFLVNADEPSGFPAFAQSTIDLLADFGAVIIDGDIHAQIVGSIPNSDGSRRVADFTVPSAASGHLRNAFIAALAFAENRFGQGVAAALFAPFVSFKYDPMQLAELVEAIDAVIVHNTPAMIQMNSDAHGYTVFEATESAFTANFRMIATREIINRLYHLPPVMLDELFTEEYYRLEKQPEGDYTGPTLVDTPVEPNRDRDGDTLTLTEEEAIRTDPTKADTDGDGVPDDVENALVYLDPLDGGDAPQILRELFTVEQVRELRVAAPTIETANGEVTITFDVEELNESDMTFNPISGGENPIELTLPLIDGKRIVRLRLRQ